MEENTILGEVWPIVSEEWLGENAAAVTTIRVLVQQGILLHRTKFAPTRSPFMAMRTVTTITIPGRRLSLSRGRLRSDRTAERTVLSGAASSQTGMSRPVYVLQRTVDVVVNEAAVAVVDAHQNDSYTHQHVRFAREQERVGED